MSEQISQVGDIINSLSELLDDSSVPKNVRIQVQIIIASFKTETELPMKISRALSGLDEMASDVNLQSYTRTQIWNVISLLEKIN